MYKGPLRAQLCEARSLRGIDLPERGVGSLVHSDQIPRFVMGHHMILCRIADWFWRLVLSLIGTKNMYMMVLSI